ncbi:hypothetical protein B566_EDAN017166 [Ephemera danica]|nr:hypothetical protein B566_EDAN017166 [Ephemera danica]
MMTRSLVIIIAVLVCVNLCEATVKYVKPRNATGLKVALVKLRGVVVPGTGRYPTWLGEVPMYHRWPGGIVPYTYSPLFTAAERAQFDRAIADYNKYTCIKFIPRTDQHDYMFVQGERSGCYAVGINDYLGRYDNNGEGQWVNLERNTWCTQFVKHYEDYLQHVQQENMFPDQDPDTFGLPDYNIPPREEKDLGLSALEKFRIRRMYKCYGSTSLLYA